MWEVDDEVDKEERARRERAQATDETNHALTT
jgi:hypothetical protein